MSARAPYLIPRPTVDFRVLDDFIKQELMVKAKPVYVGVRVEGDAARYALVWEWGNVRQTKKGPKTIRSRNPAGEPAWLTIQAPRGYIRINKAKYWQAMREELERVRFFSGSAAKLDDQLRLAMNRTANRAVRIVQSTVPVDTANLWGSIFAVHVNEMPVGRQR